MKWTFAIAHWALTLLLAPITSQVIQYVWGKDPHQVVGLLEVYPITLIFSIAFSVPAFLVYVICFYFLLKQGVHLTIAKLILIVVSVIGIIITQTIVKGSMSQEIIIAYSVTSVVVGVVLKLKGYRINTKENRLTT